MQLTLDFRPGLTQQFRTLRLATHAAVLNARGGVQAIAPAVDMSPSLLGRKLSGNPDDPHRTLDIDDWVEVVRASGDLTPIYWLVERFLPNCEQKRSAAIDQLTRLMPQVAALLEVAAPADAAKRQRR